MMKGEKEEEGEMANRKKQARKIENKKRKKKRQKMDMYLLLLPTSNLDSPGKLFTRPS